MQEKSSVNKLRRQLAEEGYLLRKSRKELSSRNYGGYMIVNAGSNSCATGPNFDCSIEDAKEFYDQLMVD
ncbi:MAG: hypothetical protein LBM60_02125 [Clostridium sp.]|nr:hypothetical protein [Clostridium sp.]